jgi:hypothetical protein
MASLPALVGNMAPIHHPVGRMMMTDLDYLLRSIIAKAIPDGVSSGNCTA